MEEVIQDPKEAFWRIKQALSFRFSIVGFFLLVAFFLKFAFKSPLPTPLFFLISLIAFSAFTYKLIISKIKNPTSHQIIYGYFSLLCFDAVVLTIIIYFLGGITWIGFVFYAFYFYPLFILLPRILSFLYFVYCTLLYTILVLMQYFEILPYQNLFGFQVKIYQDQSFVLTSLIASIATLWALGYFGDFSFRLLKEKIETIQKAKILLEKEKASLDKKVIERTRELRKKTKELAEAKANLEIKVKQRTKQLQQKVLELEKFYKAAVGRELKMRELKKELKRLKRVKLKRNNKPE